MLGRAIFLSFLHFLSLSLFLALSSLALCISNALHAPKKENFKSAEGFHEIVRCVLMLSIVYIPAVGSSQKLNKALVQ